MHLSEPYRSNVADWRDTRARCAADPGLRPARATSKHVYDDDDDAVPRSAAAGWRGGDIRVWAVDTLVAAERLFRDGGGLTNTSSADVVRKVAVLSMADDLSPMGFVTTGLPAQEESLCRDSTLSLHIDGSPLYPILDDEVLYSPGVVVFKHDARALASPFEVDVISCPGIRHPRLVSSTSTMSDEDATRLRRKIRAILQVARMEGVTHLVLGALGCGAGRNPPRQVATIFRDECH
eukprot:366377-Chlamydomonas_euryale.AAC.11